MNLIIILTGTVKPAVVGGNFSVAERMDMYTSTLRFYAKEIGTKYPIIFVENSDVDLSGWREEFRDSLNLEVIQFRPSMDDEFDNSRGKGYNEYLMIKKGLYTSTNTSPNGNYTHFLKITGRYAMVNILDMICEIEHRIRNKAIVFFGDIKDTCLYEILGINTLSSHWGDSRFFVAQIDFYKKEMIDCYKKMNDYEEGKWAEQYFLNLSRQYRKDSRFIFRYRHQVSFNGVSGTLNSQQLALGIKHQDSLANRMKIHVRRFLRILFPYIWF